MSSASKKRKRDTGIVNDEEEKSDYAPNRKKSKKSRYSVTIGKGTHDEELQKYLTQQLSDLDESNDLELFRYFAQKAHSWKTFKDWLFALQGAEAPQIQGPVAAVLKTDRFKKNRLHTDFLEEFILSNPQNVVNLLRYFGGTRGLLQAIKNVLAARFEKAWQKKVARQRIRDDYRRGTEALRSYVHNLLFDWYRLLRYRSCFRLTALHMQRVDKLHRTAEDDDELPLPPWRPEWREASQLVQLADVRKETSQDAALQDSDKEESKSFDRKGRRWFSRSNRWFYALARRIGMGHTEEPHIHKEVQRLNKIPVISVQEFGSELPFFLGCSQQFTLNYFVDWKELEMRQPDDNEIDYYVGEAIRAFGRRLCFTSQATHHAPRHLILAGNASWLLTSLCATEEILSSIPRSPIPPPIVRLILTYAPVYIHVPAFDTAFL
jgi:hypothetical protein